MEPNSTTVTPPRPKGTYHGPGRSEGHISRPPNAFMLYRSDFLRKGVIPPHVESKQQNLSCIVAKCWKSLPAEEQKPWNDLAKKIKREHALRYPGFHYKPTPRGSIKRRRQANTREQQLAKCDELIFKYIPDKAGAITDAKVPSKRKTRVSCPSPQRSPHDIAATRNAESSISLSSSLPQDPIFMEPLTQASSPPSVHSTYSSWAKQVEHPPIRDTHDNLHQSSLFSNVSGRQVPTQSSPPDTAGANDSSLPLDVVRGIYNQVVIPPTDLEAQTIFGPQPFFIEQLLTEEKQDTMRHVISPPIMHRSGPTGVPFSDTTPQQGGHHQHPPTYGTEPFPSRYPPPPLPLIPSLEPFQGPVEVDEHMGRPQLDVPFFASERAPPLDFGFSTHLFNRPNPFSDLFGTDDAFGEAMVLGLGSSNAASDWLTAPIDDLLQARASPTED